MPDRAKAVSRPWQRRFVICLVPKKHGRLGSTRLIRVLIALGGMALRPFSILFLIALIFGCEASASGGGTETGAGSQAEREERQPSELCISVSGPDGRLELVLTDPRLIVRLCLQPLASARDGRDPSSHGISGTLKLKYRDGTSEAIDLLVPFGHVRRGGRVLVANLDALKKHMEVAARSAFGLENGRSPKPKAFLRGHTDRIVALAFSPDGRYLASAGEDPEIMVWRTATGSLHSLLDGQGPACSVSFSPDGHSLAVGRRDEDTKRPEGVVGIVDWMTGNVQTSFHSGLYGGRSTAFTQDGRLLAAGRASGVTVWDLSTSQELANLKGRSGIVNKMAFAPDAQSLATGDFEGGVVLWDLATNTARASHRGHQQQVTSVAFTPDGKTFVTASKDNEVKLWETATGKEIAHYQEGLASGWGDRSCHAALAPDGRAIFSVSEMTVRRRDLKTGKITASCELSLGGRRLFVERMVFSRDCKMLAGVCRPQEAKEAEEGSAVLWDIASLIQAGSR